MPRKAQKNGFWYFMQDFRENEERSGRKFPGGLKEIQMDPKCAKEWNALSAEEKNAYNVRGRRIQPEAKLTTLGESLELLNKKKAEKEQYESDMRKYIDGLIQRARLIDELGSQTFYFIHVNYYYQKPNQDTSADYIPAEFAVVKFSLKEGANAIYHVVLKPDIELGYEYEVRTHAAKTHQLVDNLPTVENDYKSMYNKLVDFLKPQKVSNKLPPLYTSKSTVNIVSCLFERMTAAAGKESDFFDLYSLEYLLGAHMLYLDDEVPDSSSATALAGIHLNNETFGWSPGIECSYHLGLEGTSPYCSQSIVQQWAFTFCDVCCPKLDIKMVSGIHYPEKCSDSLYDSMTTRMGGLNISKSRNTWKSTTGVSEGYREMVGNRSRADDEKRKKDGAAEELTIIDHSKLPEEKPITNYSAMKSAPASAPASQWGQTRTMASMLGTDVTVPQNDDTNFPSLGARRARGPRPEKSRNPWS